VSSLVSNRQAPWETPVAARSPVVAVLPLTNASGDAARDYVATGVAENLVTRLAGVPAITVLSRAAVIDVHRRQTDLAALARELDASFLVDGSVQQSGRQLRIDLRLVAPDGSIAWADSVEGDLDHVFELQRRLAAAVAQALEVRLSAADRATLARQPTASLEALEAYWRGRAFLDRRDVKGNLDAALAAFNDALALDPRFADAHAARGEAFWARYNETNDPQFVQLAIAAGTDALRFDPDRPQVRYLLALTLEGSGRLDEAVEELQRALALQPQYDDARSRLGAVLARQGKIDEAVAEFQKAIDLRPRFWGHYSAMGTSLFQAGRYQEAAAAFTRVIELQPDSAFGYQQLGVVYHSLGDTNRALENYRKAIAITPVAQAYSNIGAILHQRGDFAGAVDAYQQAIALRPNAHITHRNQGDALNRLGRLRDARAAYARAAALVEDELAINPRDGQRHAFLAVYLAKLGQHERALSAINDAERLAPNDIQVQYRAGVVHAFAGRTDLALDALSRAVAGGFSRSRIRDDEDLTRLAHLAAFQQLVTPPSPGGNQ
jgi:tetratricopeptide (TPR) repeat protein/TolB-like protein